MWKRSGNSKGKTKKLEIVRNFFFRIFQKGRKKNHFSSSGKFDFDCVSVCICVLLGNDFPPFSRLFSKDTFHFQFFPIRLCLGVRTNFSGGVAFLQATEIFQCWNEWQRLRLVGQLFFSPFFIQHKILRNTNGNSILIFFNKFSRHFQH
jgi:hypothetical protein